MSQTTQTLAVPDCPSCASSQTTFVIARAGVNVFACQTCELTYADVDETDVIKTDPDFYHAIDASYDTQLNLAREILPGRIAHYEKTLGRPIKSILEVGCATGAYAVAFKELGITYTGVEIDGENATKAKARTGANIIHANFMDIEFDAPIDVFFCSQVLEHVPDPTAFIQKARVCVPDGLIHIDVPNHDSLASDLRKKRSDVDYGFIQPPHHMIAYNAAALRNLLERCGISPIFCKAHKNNAAIWGQLKPITSLKQRVSYTAASVLGKGSLLVAFAKTAG